MPLKYEDYKKKPLTEEEKKQLDSLYEEVGKLYQSAIFNGISDLGFELMSLKSMGDGAWNIEEDDFDSEEECYQECIQRLTKLYGFFSNNGAALLTNDILQKKSVDLNAFFGGMQLLSEKFGLEFDINALKKS